MSAAQPDETAQLLSAESKDNVADKVELQLDPKWSASFAARTVIDRNKAEADVKVKDGWQNELRAMLGLTLQGRNIPPDSDVWLHRLNTDCAVKAGATKIAGAYGCQNPATGTAAPGKWTGRRSAGAPVGEIPDDLAHADCRSCAETFPAKKENPCAHC